MTRVNHQTRRRTGGEEMHANAQNAVNPPYCTTNAFKEGGEVARRYPRLYD